ncbi:MAG: hypothetical protein AB7F59_13615 [Bdellovibrionales bacterium]
MKSFALFILAFAFLSPAVHADIGVKNYRQVYSAMSIVTGVPKENPSTAAYFAGAYRRLSETGAVSSVTAPLLLTTTVLASRFCKEMINADAAKPENQRAAHGAVDFTKSPEQFTQAAQKDVLTRYAYLFWGLQPTATELTTGMTAFAEAGVGLQQTPESLKLVLMAGCTPALASLNLITH